MINKINIGIIGSNGFIGKHLTKEILKKISYNKLYLFGRASYNESIDFCLNKNIEYIQIDLTDKNTYQNKFRDLDLIYYLASDTIPLKSWENPVFELNSNILPFIEFLEEIKNSTVKKIIFTSSAGTIYGPSKKIKNETSYTIPFSPYGIGKLTMEHFLEYYRVNYNINYIIYRISNVYGPDMDISKGLGIINTIIENLVINKSSTIFGNGEAYRNYIFVNDVASILAFSSTFSLCESNTVNLASSKNHSVNQIIKIIEKISSSKLKLNFIKKRNSDNPTIKISNNKLLKIIPSISLTSIEEGIKLTFDHIKEKNNEKRKKI
jgi:UDP-glucose 4-epimerase